MSKQSIQTESGYSAAFGDFDDDGDLDVMIANLKYSGGVPNAVWLNDGSGAFTDSGQKIGNKKSFPVTLGDINGDGKPDAMSANYGDPNCVWVNE